MSATSWLPILIMALVLASSHFVGGTNTPLKISANLATSICHQRAQFMKTSRLSPPIKMRSRNKNSKQDGWHLFETCDGAGGRCSYTFFQQSCDTPQYNIEVVVNSAELGEGPHWVAEKQELLFVDISGHKIHRFIPSTREDFVLSVDGTPGFIVPVDSKKNKYIVGLNRSIVEIVWDGESPRPSKVTDIFGVEKDKPANRFNDGKCDNQGRLWMGTMGYPSGRRKVLLEDSTKEVDKEGGSLYTLGLNGGLTNKVKKIGISNGLAWSNDSTKFYYIDSVKYRIDLFDFDAETGCISNRRVLTQFEENQEAGLPDGMTIDVEGNLWVAAYFGSKIWHVHGTTGKVLQVIDFTGRASKISSTAWGGPNFDILYVTSSKYNLTPEQLLKEPDAGATFALTNLGTRGYPATNYKGQYQKGHHNRHKS